jgi:hypothetical protein
MLLLLAESLAGGQAALPLLMLPRCRCHGHGGVQVVLAAAHVFEASVELGEVLRRRECLGIA